jgi:signal recognition particle subunit SRP54
MTPEERKNPALINGSRRQRIATGSGNNIVPEVNKLMKQFEETRKMMKMMGDKSKMQNMMQQMQQAQGMRR